MRKRVLSFVLILYILFSNIGSEIVFAEGEEELFEAEKVQLDEEVQSDEEVQVNEEVQLDEETTDETAKIAYNIYFDGLREDNETWIYTNESEYSIEVNTEELPDEEGEIVWEILDSHWDFPLLDAATFMKVLGGLLSESFLSPVRTQ